MMNQHEQHLNPETEVPQWNSVIINVLFTLFLLWKEETIVHTCSLTWLII